MAARSSDLRFRLIFGMEIFKCTNDHGHWSKYWVQKQYDTSLNNHLVQDISKETGSKKTNISGFESKNNGI